MSNTIEITFRVFTTDEFKQKVAEYVDRPVNEITDDDVYSFLQDHINPARSEKRAAFEVEGGDTDGCFIDSYRLPEGFLDADEEE